MARVAKNKFTKQLWQFLYLQLRQVKLNIIQECLLNIFPTYKRPKKHTDHSLKNLKTYDDYKEMGIDNQEWQFFFVQEGPR